MSPKLEKLVALLAIILMSYVALGQIHSTENGEALEKVQITNPTPPPITNTEPKERETLKEVIRYLVVEDKNFEGAIRASDDFTKKYGDDVDVWVHRGMSYYQLSDCVNAIASLYHASQMGRSSETISTKDITDLLDSVLNSPLCKK